MSRGPGLWQKFKDKYGEEDKLSNFFAGDHSRPTERIRNIQRQPELNYPAGPLRRSSVIAPAGPAPTQRARTVGTAAPE